MIMIGLKTMNTAKRFECILCLERPPRHTMKRSDKDEMIWTWKVVSYGRRVSHIWVESSEVRRVGTEGYCRSGIKLHERRTNYYLGRGFTIFTSPFPQLRSLYFVSTLLSILPTTNPSNLAFQRINCSNPVVKPVIIETKNK